MADLHPIIANWYHHCPNCQSPLRKEERSAHCSNCNFAFYVNPAPCVTVIVTKGDRVLIARRAIDPKKDLWNWAGGFIEPSETAEDAVRRELREEINAEVTNIHQLGSTFPDIYSEIQDPTLTFLYVAELVGDEVKAADDVSELKWVDPTTIDLNDLAFANDREALRRYLEYRTNQGKV